MKKLIIINGTMGVGKSTVCNVLLDSPGIYIYTAFGIIKRL
ncbi:hypothetical protein [Clostridium bowmanii]|nr:hypothetical protein [Clostridium bowmanii]